MRNHVSPDNGTQMLRVTSSRSFKIEGSVTEGYKQECKTNLVRQSIGSKFLQGQLEFTILIFTCQDDFDRDRHVW